MLDEVHSLVVADKQLFHPLKKWKINKKKKKIKPRSDAGERAEDGQAVWISYSLPHSWEPPRSFSGRRACCSIIIFLNLWVISLLSSAAKKI